MSVTRERGLAGPAGFLALRSFVFEVDELLIEGVNFLFSCVDFGLVVIDVGTHCSAASRLLGVAVILDLIFCRVRCKNV